MKTIKDLSNEELQIRLKRTSDILLGIRKANTRLFTPQRTLDALLEIKGEIQRRGIKQLEFA